MNHFSLKKRCFIFKFKRSTPYPPPLPRQHPFRKKISDCLEKPFGYSPSENSGQRARNKCNRKGKTRESSTF